MPSSAHTDPHLWVVILAGGAGSRFWPASTATRPKPLFPLGRSGRTLLRETVDRALGLVPPERLSLLIGEGLLSAFRGELPELPESSFWIEPEPRGTAPVLAWAAHRIHAMDPEAVMASLHSDHRIDPEETFQAELRAGATLASQLDRLFTIAVRPDRPETGYGYLLPREVLGEVDGVQGARIARFREKPNLALAEEFLRDGYLWNSGIFLLPVRAFLREIGLHAPEVAAELGRLDSGDVAGFFRSVPSISVDEAVFERSSSTGTLSGSFRWDDIGGWASLARILPGDEKGNHVWGGGQVVDSEDCIVWAEGEPVVLYGVQGLVAVRAAGVTLVTTRERSPHLKELLAALERGGGLPPRGTE